MITRSEESLNNVFGIESDIVDVESVDVDTGEIVEPKTNLPSTVSSSGGLLTPNKQERDENDQFKKDAKEDFDLARNNIKNLIYQGEDLLELAMRSAQSTEDPDVIGGAARILNSLTSMNKQLMELNKQRQEIYMRTRTSDLIKSTLKENPDAKVELKQVNQNISFVGTSNDLAKMIQDMQKGQ